MHSKTSILGIKKIISTFLIFSILFSSMAIVNAEKSCKYTAQIEECLEANKNWSTRAIENFLCPSTIDKEKMVYNIILYDKFKEIDEKADELLDSLEQNKDLYFWENKKETFLWWIDEIYNQFWVWGIFEQKYKKQLPLIIAETIVCLDWKKTAINKVKDYFLENKTVNNLINAKNSRRQKVAIDIMTLNKQQIRKDSSKKSTQIRRTMYSSVSNLFMINLGYIMRIMFKWASKTKNPY